MDSDILLPKKIGENLKGIQYSNAYMLLNKYLIMEQKNRKIENNISAKTIERVVNASNQEYLKAEDRQTLLSLIPGYQYKEIAMLLSSPLIVGLGQPSVTETSMTLHPIYGVVYIPGQAFKGIVRSYWIKEHFESDEKEAMKDEEFAFIFGREDIEASKKAQKGKIIFHDVFVDGKCEIKKDIMNCHYVEYYKNGTMPDTIKPNIISFYVVASGKFKFGYSVSTQLEDGNEKCNKLKANIIEALTSYGIGAKTAVGYGYFDQPQADNNKVE